MLFLLINPNILAEIPGLSGMPEIVSLDSFLLYETPLTISFSINFSSFTINVHCLLEKEDKTCKGILFFIASSTDRVCKTLAPVEDISSISS